MGRWGLREPLWTAGGRDGSLRAAWAAGDRYLYQLSGLANAQRRHSSARDIYLHFFFSLSRQELRELLSALS